MTLDKLIDKNSPNREVAMKIFETGNTRNEFQYFNIDNLDYMNKVYDYYVKYAQSLIDMMSPENNIFNEKNIKELDFSYAWESRLNAGSHESGRRDIIRINEGTIMKIYAFFYTLMAKGKILGIDSVESTVLELNLIAHNDTEENIVVPMVLCGSEKRNNIAEYMARFAIEFLVGHEIGHAFNGHTKYYSTILKNIEKEHDEKEREQLFLDLQTLEVDADAFGIGKVLEDALYLIEKNDKIVDILGKKQDMFEMLCYAIHGLFCVMREEYGYNDIQKYKEKVHPPKFVRESMLYGALHEQLKFLNKKKITKCKYNFREINIGAIEYDICAAMQHENREYIQFIENNFQLMAEHVNNIEKNWKRVSWIIKSEARLPIEGLDFN